jgi:hypothetical protein
MTGFEHVITAGMVCEVGEGGAEAVRWTTITATGKVNGGRGSYPGGGRHTQGQHQRTTDMK